MSAPKETTRSFLDIILEGTIEFESPERYYWWSGLAAIAAVVSKKIHLNRQRYKLYPNVYVALVSNKSGLRKGDPISLCKELLQECGGVRIISGCNSIQGLIHDLSMQKTFPDGSVLNKAQGIMISSEFVTFLTADPNALDFLIELYNVHEHEESWEKTLKGSPVEKLRSPCLSMLIASNQVMFNDVVKQKQREGGFIGRTFLIYEKHTKTINDLIDPPEIELDTKALVSWLKKISKVEGEFRWTSGAIDVYRPWYRKLALSLRSEDVEDATGTLNRLGDQVLRVAMLISLSRKEDLDLVGEDLSLAIDKCEECMQAAQVSGVSGSQKDVTTTEAGELILSTLLGAKNRTMSRTDIARKYRRKGVDVYMLNKVMETLVGAGLVEQNNAPKVGTYYTATEKADEGWKSFR